MKLDFKSPELSDLRWAEPILSGSGIDACDYNFTNLFLWRRACEQKICLYDGILFIKVKGIMGDAFLMPVGDKSLEYSLGLLKSSIAENEKLRLVCVTEKEKEKLQEEFQAIAEFTENRDYWDYVYSVDKLADLKGRKMHSKRNHINRFMEDFRDWTFEKLSDDNAAECMRLVDKWKDEKKSAGADKDLLTDEYLVDMDILKYKNELNILGGVLRVNGSIAAFSAGSLLNRQTFDVNVEKADDSFPGSYALVNQQTARLVRSVYPDVKWINREDDLGISGLRKSKLSYYPDLMVKKYTALI